MKIREKELKEVIRKVVKTQLAETKAQLNEAGDFMSRRELLNKARDASFKFEKEIISSLDLEDPNTMPIEKRTEFLRIMREMEKGVVKAVAGAVIAINKANIPTKAEEVEVQDIPAAMPSSATPVSVANDSTKPLARVAESKGKK